jgi:hypothetical protein
MVLHKRHDSTRTSLGTSVAPGFQMPAAGSVFPVPPLGKAFMCRPSPFALLCFHNARYPKVVGKKDPWTGHVRVNVQHTPYGVAGR